ncbi:MAG: endonuclease/exonuclease/phosphatase family protein [Candidatus Cloacimonetes bacterium]|nr:endonuclease/exonuclease/phosphatase family protein [Candidatus Cloacimonadota bacterium]
MRRIWIAIMVVFIIISCGKTESGPTSVDPPIVPILDSLFFGTDSTFEIVTWNIEHFAKQNQVTVNYVVQIILAIDADVFALQEIESSGYFDYVVDELNEIDSLYNWDRYKANSTYIDLAYIYKSNSSIDIFEIYNSDDYSREFPRSPLVMQISHNGNEIHVINNHLKAMGDGTMNLNDPWDEETRRFDACNLLDEYIAVNLTQSNVIVLGDLNDILTDEQINNVFWTFISQPDNYIFADMDIAEGSSSNWSWQGWNSSYPPSHLDHILITNELFDEFEDTLSTVKTIKIDEYLDVGWNEYDTNVSDHRPVGLKLKFE